MVEVGHSFVWVINWWDSVELVLVTGIVEFAVVLEYDLEFAVVIDFGLELAAVFDFGFEFVVVINFGFELAVVFDFDFEFVVVLDFGFELAVVLDLGFEFVVAAVGFVEYEFVADLYFGLADLVVFEVEFVGCLAEFAEFELAVDDSVTSVAFVVDLVFVEGFESVIDFVTVAGLDESVFGVEVEVVVAAFAVFLGEVEYVLAADFVFVDFFAVDFESVFAVEVVDFEFDSVAAAVFVVELMIAAVVLEAAEVGTLVAFLADFAVISTFVVIQIAACSPI